MTRDALTTVRIEDFGGLVSHRGRFPEHPGDASAQENVRATSHGDLAVRKGMREVEYSGFPGAYYDTVDLYYYGRDGSPCIVMVDSHGSVYYGEAPE